MRRRKIRSIAKRWWSWQERTGATEDYAAEDWYPFNRVHDLVQHRANAVPELIAALIETVPPRWLGSLGGVPFVGTTIVEDIEHRLGPERTVRALMAARLQPELVQQVLSGVARAPLQRILASAASTRLLTKEQRSWLHNQNPVGDHAPVSDPG